MSWTLQPLSPTFEAALRDVQARRPQSRLTAAQRLAHPDEGREAEARQGLVALARDDLARVRRAALDGLAAIGDPSCFDELIAHLEDPHPDVREMALVALSEIDDERALPVLTDALDSPHPEVRFQAVYSCAQRCPEAARAQIERLCGDEEPRVRAHALSALDSQEQQIHDGILRGGLQDDAPEVQLEAAMALARRGDASGLARLCEALHEPERVLDAVQALAELADPESADPLARLALSVLQPRAVKTAAARALVCMDDRRGVEGLREVLTGWRSGARSYAVQVVGELGVDALAPELARLSRRPRGTDPAVLAEALARLAPRNPEARRALLRLTGRDDDVGARARQAIGAEPSV